MAKRPQRRPGELTAPALSEPAFTTPATPVDTSITPSQEGAPAQPILTPDPARPDTTEFDDMRRMGQALSSLSQAAATMVKYERVETDRLERLYTDQFTLDELDKTFAQLVEEGKVGAVTPAHQRAAARAQGAVAARQEEIDARMTMEKIKEANDGNFDVDHFPQILDRMGKERRAAAVKLGISESQFNMGFNKNWSLTTQKLSKEWAEHVSERTKNQSWANIEADMRDHLGSEEELLAAAQQLIDQRGLAGELTGRGAQHAVAKGLITLREQAAQLGDEVTYDRITSVLSKLKAGPVQLIPDPNNLELDENDNPILPPDTRQEGSLLKISEVANLNAESLSKTQATLKTRAGQNRRTIHMGQRQQQVTGVFLDAYSAIASKQIDPDIVDMMREKGARDQVELLTTLLAEAPEGSVVDGDFNISRSPADPDKVRFTDSDGNTFDIDPGNLIESGREGVRSSLIGQEMSQNGLTEDEARALVSLRFNEIDPAHLQRFQNMPFLNSWEGVTEAMLKTAGLPEDATQEQIDAAIGQSTQTQEFLETYRMWNSYQQYGAGGLIATQEGLKRFDLWMRSYQMLTYSKGLTPPQAIAKIGEAQASLANGSASLAGLESEMRNQLVPGGDVESSLNDPLIRQWSPVFQFIVAGGSPTSSSVAEAVDMAKNFVKEHYVYVGGHPYLREQYPQAYFEGGQGTILSRFIGEDTAKGSPLFEAIQQGRIGDAEDIVARTKAINDMKVVPVNGVPGFYHIMVNQAGRAGDSTIPYRPLPNPKRNGEIFFSSQEIMQASSPFVKDQDLIEALDEAASLSEMKEELGMEEDIDSAEVLAERARLRSTGLYSILMTTEEGASIADEIRRTDLKTYLKNNQYKNFPRFSGARAHLSHALRHPEAVRAYRNLDPATRAALGEEFAWIGDATVPVPDEYRVGVLFGSVNTRPLTENDTSFANIRSLFADMVDVDTMETVPLGQRKEGVGGRGSNIRKTALLVDLMSASVEGTVRLREILDAEESEIEGRFLDLTEESEWLEAPDTRLAYFSLDEKDRAQLGSDFFFLGDARATDFSLETEVMSDEDYELLEELDLNMESEE